MGGGKKVSQWILRQSRDHFVRLRDERNLRSRSSFKLEQVDDKYKFLRPGKLIVDVGAAPGGWTQIAIERSKPTILKNDFGFNNVVANDLLSIKPLAGCTFIQGDFTTYDVQKSISDHFEGRKVDVVLSDMAPNGSGDKTADHFRQLELCYYVLDFSLQMLVPKESSIMLCKVYQGEEEKSFINEVKKYFKTTHRIKPDASRKESREFYLLATKPCFPKSTVPIDDLTLKSSS